MPGGLVTITGAAGLVDQISLNSTQTLALAQQIAADINSAAARFTLTAVNFPGPFGSIPSGNTGEAVIAPGTPSGVFTAPAGYQYVVDSDTVPVTINGASNQTVLAGTGGLTFNGGAGANNEIVAGGGNNLIALGAGATGLVVLGDGNDTVYSNGSVSIDAGTGTNLIFAGGAGTNGVIVTGSGTNGTIVGGAGNTTIFGSNAGNGNTDFLGSGNTEFVEGSGADTVNVGAGAATIFGNVGGGVIFGNTGALTFVGGTGPNTIIGGATSPTLFGSSGSDITYSGKSGALLVAGGGNETLNAAGATVANTIFGGTGNDSLVAGSGADTIVAGAGAMTALGGSGNDVFAFFHGLVGSSQTDVVQNFSTKDLVLLSGYGANGVASSVTGGGNTTLTLSDDTKITFTGVTNLNLNQIIKT